MSEGQDIEGLKRPPRSEAVQRRARELLTPPCRHERVEFPPRPLPDAWYPCPDCGERVGLRAGRVITLRESNAIAEPVTTELKPGRSYVVRLAEHVSPEAMEVLVERLKQTAPQSGFLVVDASVVSVDDPVSQSVATADPRPFVDCFIGSDPWEPTHKLWDSRFTQRVVAIRATADEYGIGFEEAKCTTVYARWLTRQDIWDYGAGERWWDDQGEIVDGKWVPLDDGSTGPPDTPPEDWQPDPERDVTFELCSNDAPGAVKCWQVETGIS